MIDLDELQRIASAATPGPWIWHTPDDRMAEMRTADGKVIFDFGDDARYDQSAGTEPDAADVLFMQAANPSVILDLIGIARAAADSLPKIKEGASLPELPDGCNVVYFANGVRHIMDDSENFSAAQMREYGAACAAAAAARLAAPASQAAEPAAEQLRAALEALLNRYCGLAASGDAGNWDWEAEPEVVASRAALAGAAPVEAASPWISVKDRLPENMQQVLTCGPLYDEPGRGMWIESARFAGVFFDFNDDEGEDHYAPTHWMPMIELPAAPAPEATPESDGCAECKHTYMLTNEKCRHCGYVAGSQGWQGGRAPGEAQ